MLRVGDECEYRVRGRGAIGSWNQGTVQAVFTPRWRTDPTYEVAPLRSGPPVALGVRDVRAPRGKRAGTSAPQARHEPRKRRANTGARIGAEQGRDEAYLAFVRSQSCCCCCAPAPVDAHHFGPRGVGQKTSDYRTAPLCSGPAGCHAYWHAHGELPNTRGRDHSEALLFAAQVTLLLRWHSGQVSSQQ